MSSDGAAQSRSNKADSRITMDLLHAVEGNARNSQRSLAKQMNIALGLTNAYLKRCIRKGWVKVQMAPPNRYAYYLTPKGSRKRAG